MANVLRNEVNDKLIITHRDNELVNTFETCTYLITDQGLVWLSRYFSIIVEFDFEKYIEEIKDEYTPEYIAKIKWALVQKRDELFKRMVKYFDIPDAIYEAVEELWLERLEEADEKDTLA